MMCPLTGRQIEAVTLLADGLSAKEIAIQWGQSYHWVNNCIYDAMKVSGTSKSTGLVAMALRKGWIQ